MSESRPLPPGTILQLMYVRERLRLLRAGSFVEVGAGEGALTRLLLDRGWRGKAYDLNEAALARAAERCDSYVATGHLELVRADWLRADDNDRADLVIGSMVLEHLPEHEVSRFLACAAATVEQRGRLILLVPSSPANWGIEDEVAGHLRRYTRVSLRATLEERGWMVDHLAGLTFPLSNVLLRLSNRLVAEHERDRLELSLDARTIASGRRAVPWKTSFPGVATLVLNRAVMYPFHVAQKAALGSDRALVLYCEARPVAAADGSRTS